MEQTLLLDKDLAFVIIGVLVVIATGLFSWAGWKASRAKTLDNPAFQEPAKPTPPGPRWRPEQNQATAHVTEEAGAADNGGSATDPRAESGNHPA